MVTESQVAAQQNRRAARDGAWLNAFQVVNNVYTAGMEEARMHTAGEEADGEAAAGQPSAYRKRCSQVSGRHRGTKLSPFFRREHKQVLETMALVGKRYRYGVN